MASIKNMYMLLVVISASMNIFVEAIPLVYLNDNGVQLLQPFQQNYPLNYFNSFNTVNGAGFVQYPIPTSGVNTINNVNNLGYPSAQSTIINTYPSVVPTVPYGVQPFINGYPNQVISNSQNAPVEINLTGN